MKFDVSAFIQAGGRSSRMGVDKAWLEINNRPMIEHVLSAAQSVAADLSIVIHPANPNAARYRQLAERRHARLLEDLHDHQGPLGGIHTALTVPNRDRQGAAALILACDLPFLSAEFLEFLCREHRQRNAQATVPLGEDGRLQPLVAVYEQSCLAVVEEKLARQELKVERLLDAVSAERIAFQEFAHLPGASKFFLNLNTMAEYRNAAPDSPAGESGAC